MDQQAAKRLIEDTFNQPFDEGRFRHFAINLLNNVDEGKAFNWTAGAYIKDSFKDHVKKYRRLGTYTDPNGQKIDVLVSHLRNPWALDRSRATQRNFVATYLKKRGEKDAALIAYYTDDPEDWRFSFVRMEYQEEVTPAGKVRVKEEFTPARRYSFLVGENEPSHTAQEQLLPLLEDENPPTIDTIEQAFSVEAVTKRFYTDYRGLFEKLTAELERLVEQDKRVREEFESKSIDPANFVKKLLGQIVFLYFLQKKGWLGVGKDEQGNLKPWGTGPKNFLQRLFKREFIGYANFFDDILEPLFYEALATERPDDYYSRFNCKIPFLNGGLFEAIHDYNWREIDVRLSNDLFQQIFSTFDLYNFTVREDEPLEKEVAVDPEMLGKVFENLLPENLRKGKGTYYTPRPIVHYMCQETLTNYLAGECEGVIPKEHIEELIRRGESAVENDAVSVQKRLENENYKGDYKPIIRPSIINNAQFLDDKLARIKVCDPAVGSGAFPVAMMHEIVKARNVLTNYLPDKTGRDTYSLKRHCIQESLYGVDIDPGAIDIGKLRLWLSLIVDEEDYERINPLPNLDYKIMQGNSLIEDFHGISLDLGKSDNGDLLGKDPEVERLIVDLHEKQNALFNATHPGEKQRLKDAVEEAVIGVFRYRLQQEKKPYYDSLESIERTASILPESLRDQYRREETKKLNKRFDFDPEAVERELREMTHGNKLRNFFPWRLYFADVFREKGGFDVVIANPPYGLKVPTEIRDRYFPSNTDGKQSKDSYGIFLARGMQILRKEGHLCFITSDTWQTLKSHKPLRRLLLENAKVRHVMAMPGWVFGAMVNTSILSLKYLPGEAFTQEREENELWACDFTRLPNRDDKTLSQVLASWDSQDISLGENKYRIAEAPNVPEDFGRDIPIARYRYPQKLIPLFSSIPFFIGSPKLYRLMNDTTVPVVEKEIGESKKIRAKVRQVKFNGKAVELVRFGDIAEVRVGLQTSDNPYYLCKAPGARGSYEVIDYSKVLTEEEIRTLTEEQKREGIDPDKYDGRHFLPYDKGEESEAEEGWLPNYWVPTSYFIDWSKDAVYRLKTLTVADRKRFYGKEDAIKPEDETKIASRFQNKEYYFLDGLTFSWTGVYAPSFRLNCSSAFDHGSSNIFTQLFDLSYLLGILGSKFIKFTLKNFINHSVNTQIDDIKEVSFAAPPKDFYEPISKQVNSIIREQKYNPHYPYHLYEQIKIDQLVYELYGLSDEDVAEIEAWYERRYPKLAQAQRSAYDDNK